MCLVTLIHLISGGFQAFGLLSESLTQRMARASAFIVYSRNALIVFSFAFIVLVFFPIAIKIFNLVGFVSYQYKLLFWVITLSHIPPVFPKFQCSF